MALFNHSIRIAMLIYFNLDEFRRDFATKMFYYYTVRYKLIFPHFGIAKLLLGTQKITCS